MFWPIDRLSAVLLATGAIAFVAPPAAGARVFGTEPIPISVAADGESAVDGPAGKPSISGDNRKGRLVAFHSDASNLIGGDANGATDVFVWHRPRGSLGLRLPSDAAFAGDLERASVTSAGGEANGPSRNPALDGSLSSAPHCVAFESEATNLASGDRDATADVFVRDLRADRTYLVSRGIGAAATDPAIDGACGRVAFAAGGSVYVAAPRGGKVDLLGRGSNPDLALDGSAITWERGGGVVVRRDGSTTEVASSAGNPAVSDEESGVWGIVFDSDARLARGDRNGSTDVYTRKVKRRGDAFGTDLVSATRRGGSSLGGVSTNGGITAYGTNRGIITFVTDDGDEATFWYRNNNTGNIDDLAHFQSIAQPYTSARANFVAFTAPGDDSDSADAVYFKHLVDGEAL